MATQDSVNKPEMRVAEILSDLVSLRVCDPAAALALVSARPSDDSQTKSSTGEEQDIDLERAKELLKLHYNVKEAHKRGGLSRGLEDAKSAVARAVQE